MTIQFNYHWNGQDGIKTLSTVEEARLVSLGIARYYTPFMDGGPSNPEANNLELTASGLTLGGQALTAGQAELVRQGINPVSVSSGTAVPIAGTGAMVDYAVQAVAAGAVRPNQKARLTALFVKTGATGGTGIQVLFGPTVVYQAYPSTTHLKVFVEVDLYIGSDALSFSIISRNAAKLAAAAGYVYSTDGADAYRIAHDFTQDFSVKIKGQAAVGDTFALEGWSMEWN